MSSDLVKNIQIIAKTGLLEEKVGKAQATADAANNLAKSGVAGERGLADADGTVLEAGATAAVSAGMTAEDLFLVNVGATNSLDGLVSASASAAYIAQNDANSASVAARRNGGATTTPTDAGATTNANSNASLIAGGGALVTDLSKNVSGNFIPAGNTGTAAGGGSIGGSDVVNLAQQSKNDPIAQSLAAQVAAMGGSATDVQNTLAQYTNDTYGQAGVYTAQQIADNHATSVPLTMNIAYGDTGVFNPSILDSVVGFTADGSTDPITGNKIAVKVQLGNSNFPVPSDANAALLHQSPWTSALTPPPKQGYTAGTYWSYDLGVTNASTYDAFTTHWLAFQSGFPDQFDYSITYTLLIAGTYNVYLNWTPNPAHPLGGSPPPALIGEVSAYTCTGTSSYCPVSPPVETAWPVTGGVVLNLLGGHVQFSTYDSQVPSIYKAAASVVRLAIGDGSSVVDNRFMDIQPAIQGGYLISTIASDGTTVLSANYYDAQKVLQASNLSASDAAYYKPK